MNQIFPVICTLLSVIIGVANCSDLIAVAVFFRHGDRSPESSFPLDQYCTNDYFPMGFGQLTNKGIKRQYDLGLWLRERYTSFLPERYSPNDIYVMSTDVDRTLMSAAATLASLYPPGKDQIWNPKLLWRPIPIHTKPEAEDSVLSMKKKCPKFDELYEAAEKASFYQEINEEHADLYEYVSKHTGLNVVDMQDVKLIRSVFYVYKNYNVSFIPSWADSLNQTVLDYLSGLTYARKTFTPEMKRLRAGPFFQYLISYFSNIANNTSGTPKFLMMSSHDTEMVSVLDSMGVYDLYPPNFGAMVIWELRRRSDGTTFINLMFRKSDTEFLDLVLERCGVECPFEDFKKLLEPVTVEPVTWEEECSAIDTRKLT